MIQKKEKQKGYCSVLSQLKFLKIQLKKKSQLRK